MDNFTGTVKTPAKREGNAGYQLAKKQRCGRNAPPGQQANGMGEQFEEGQGPPDHDDKSCAC